MLKCRCHLKLETSQFRHLQLNFDHSLRWYDDQDIPCISALLHLSTLCLWGPLPDFCTQMQRYLNIFISKRRIPKIKVWAPFNCFNKKKKNNDLDSPFYPNSSQLPKAATTVGVNPHAMALEFGSVVLKISCASRGWVHCTDGMVFGYPVTGLGGYGSPHIYIYLYIHRLYRCIFIYFKFVRVWIC